MKSQFWAVGCGLWSVVWAGLWNKSVWADFEAHSLFRGQKKNWIFFLNTISSALKRGHHVEVGNLWLVGVGSFLWLVQVGNLWQIWEVIVLWLVQVGIIFWLPGVGNIQRLSGFKIKGRSGAIQHKETNCLVQYFHLKFKFTSNGPQLKSIDNSFHSQFN